MQLGPRQHKPQLPDVEVAFDDLDVVDPDLRLPVGVASVKVRMAVIVIVHRDHDPEEATNRRHDTGWCRPRRSTLGASVVSPTRTTDLPPIRLRLAVLALPLEMQRRTLPGAATGATERPQLLGRALVLMDQLV